MRVMTMLVIKLAQQGEANILPSNFDRSIMLCIILLSSISCGEKDRKDRSETDVRTGLEEAAHSAAVTVEPRPRAEVSTKLTEGEIRLKVEEFVRRMEMTWAPYALTGTKWYVNAAEYDWSFRLQVVHAGDFVVDVASGTILSASYHRGNRPGDWEFNTLNDDEAPLRPATLSRESVLSRAASFFEQAFPGALQEAVIEGVEHIDERHNPWNYSWWKIRWKPMFHGYPCLTDYYQVTWYDEDDQFMGFTRTISKTPVPPRLNVDKQIAWKRASEKHIWTGLESLYRVKNATPTMAKPKLYWVRPLPILEAPPFQLPNNPPEKVIALAWILSFHATINGTEDEMQIWIDTQDGEFLGANFIAH